MYDELVKRLRDDEAWKNCDFDFIYGWMHEAADAIEEIQGKYFLMKKTAEWLAEKVPRWIPVTERLPETGDRVLVYAGFFQPFNEVSYIDAEGKWRFAYDDTEVPIVTHWMPLPEPPKEGET